MRWLEYFSCGDLFVQADKWKESNSCFIVIVPKVLWWKSWTRFGSRQNNICFYFLISSFRSVNRSWVCIFLWALEQELQSFFWNSAGVNKKWLWSPLFQTIYATWRGISSDGTNIKHTFPLRKKSHSHGQVWILVNVAVDDGTKHKMWQTEGAPNPKGSLRRQAEALARILYWLIEMETSERRRCCYRKAPSGKCAKLHTVAASSKEITCHDHSIILCSRHICMGVVLRAQVVRGESHVQRNANHKKLFQCDTSKLLKGNKTETKC